MKFILYISEYLVPIIIFYIAGFAFLSKRPVFYTMSVYFMTAKVTKTRWTFAGAMLATGAGVAASIILASVG